MRIRAKRRRLLFLIKLLFICSCLVSLYMLVKSITKKEVSQPKIKVRPTVFILEEDTDVINLWQNITKDKLERLITLITFDSFCDDGVYMSWNKSVSEVRSLHDLLARLADTPLHALYPGASGLVDNVWCIYPWWKSSSIVYSNHTSYLGVWRGAPCLCTSASNVTIFNESSCRMVLPGSDISVSSSDCTPFTDPWQFVQMQDVYAQTIQKDASTTDLTVVNINLDFFTVDAGISYKNKELLHILEREINRILCPRRVQDEAVVDLWFQKLLRMAKSRVFDSITDLFIIPNLPLCMDKKVTEIRTKTLISTLRQLSDNQHHELSSLGLCILPSHVRSSSTQNHQRTSLPLGLCSGKLSRDFSFLGKRHIVGTSEITLQVEKLYLFLKQSVSEPSVITIVRSVRLGLVSPISQRRIESVILEKLKSLYNLNETDVVYSGNLLGSVDGWSQRGGLL